MSGLAVTAFLAEKIQDLKIAVIGDVMLDRYFHGEVKRISPEAPVPVTKINRPNVWVPQQFVNPDNPEVHRRTTAKEILAQVDGPIHGFCSGVGTGGTLTGIGETLKAANPDMLIWAVEPENAAILSGGSIGTHLQMGIGDGLIPDNLNLNIFSDTAIVTDEEALNTSRRLHREEGILCGISSGTNVAAALRLAEKLGAGKTVVAVLPDTGERYFSTQLFED